MSEDVNITRVLVVGGGAAGWLSAGSIAAKYPQLDVTLIEAPNIPILGVGEGTWPSMRQTLQQMGIGEYDFIRHCHASFKQGSSFYNWHSQGHEYHHPFSNPTGHEHINLAHIWQHEHPKDSFDETVCPQVKICKQGLAPKQKSTPEYAGVLTYGYHLDANKFAEFLTQHCVNKLGITHIKDYVLDVTSEPNTNDILSLNTAHSGKLSADLFVDCTGMKSRLLGNHYQVPIVDLSSTLPNNRALALQLPHAELPGNNYSAAIHSTTKATANSFGWCWDIPLSTRRGVGMVFASDFCSQHQALIELSKYTNTPDLAFDNVKQLEFTPGYRERFWQNNCVAIGMSAGFLEPLEASALAMVELSIRMLLDDFPSTKRHMSIVSQRYNKRFTYRWQRVSDFIKLHYITSKRRDSEFWCSVSDIGSASDELQSLMELWQYQAPSRHDVYENEEIFSSLSYQYVLYGMQHKSDFLHSPSESDLHAYKQIQHQNQTRQAALVRGLPNNNELLTHINMAQMEYA